MYDKDNDYFKLSVRNLNSGALCSKPQADRVSNIAWAKDGQALLYVVTDQNKRPCRWVFMWYSLNFRVLFNFQLPIIYDKIGLETFFSLVLGYTVAWLDPRMRMLYFWEN